MPILRKKKLLDFCFDFEKKMDGNLIQRGADANDYQMNQQAMT